MERGRGKKVQKGQVRGLRDTVEDGGGKRMVGRRASRDLRHTTNN